MNGLRLAYGVMLLPLLFRKLGKADVAMYVSFIWLFNFIYLCDAAFHVTLTRKLAFAMQGITELKGLGMSETKAAGEPNRPLLGQLYKATHLLYLALALLVLLVLGIYGTWQISGGILETADPIRTRLAWALTVLVGPIELLAGSNLLLLRGVNQILVSVRILAVVYGTKLLVAVILLILNFGLLSIPLATLAAAALQGILGLWGTRKFLPQAPRADRKKALELLPALWPTTWRTGLQMLAGFIAVTSLMGMGLRHFKAEAMQPFNVSWQLLMSVCIGLAATWTYTKWPIISQLQAAHDFPQLRKLLRPRIYLQVATYLAMAAGVILVVPTLLAWGNFPQHLLPTPWLLVLSLVALGEMHFSIWTMLLSTQNRIPSLWPTVATHATTLLLGFIIVRFQNTRPEYLVLAPFLSWSLFNYWWWPLAGARSIGTNWLTFMLRKPSAP